MIFNIHHSLLFFELFYFNTRSFFFHTHNEISQPWSHNCLKKKGTSVLLPLLSLFIASLAAPILQPSCHTHDVNCHLTRRGLPIEKPCTANDPNYNGKFKRGDQPPEMPCLPWGFECTDGNVKRDSPSSIQPPQPSNNSEDPPPSQQTVAEPPPGGNVTPAPSEPTPMPKMVCNPAHWSSECNTSPAQKEKRKEKCSEDDCEGKSGSEPPSSPELGPSSLPGYSPPGPPTTPELEALRACPRGNDGCPSESEPENEKRGDHGTTTVACSDSIGDSSCTLGPQSPTLTASSPPVVTNGMGREP